MTVNHRMDLDSDPPSSPPPFPACDPPPSSARVRWSHSNPERLLLKQQLIDSPVPLQPHVSLSASLHHTSLHLPNPLPSDHPAKAKRFDLHQQDSPSMPNHIHELHSAIAKMNAKLKQNAKQKADKDRRHLARLANQSLAANTDLTSDHPIRNPPTRERTMEDLIPLPSRLQSRASHPDLRPGAESIPSTPVLALSRPADLGILESLRKPMDIDWDDVPSNTPTPPSRRHLKPSSLGSSSSSSHKYDTQPSSSSSSAMSPLSIHHGAHSHSDSLDGDVSMADAGSIVISPVDPIPNNSHVGTPSVFPLQDCPSPELPPPSIAVPSRPPPARPNLPPPSPPQPTPPPPLAPPLSRPFAPPSQLRPGQTQATRPRASQHPRPLGMCRAPGQNSMSAGVNKPFKLPLAARAKRSSAPNPSIPERDGELAIGSITPFSECGGGDARRSMSPVIPDPPHIAARAQVQGSQSPVLEMSARGPEPRDDQDDEGKDADSSADLWACFDD